jgi:hypothetical protein
LADTSFSGLSLKCGETNPVDWILLSRFRVSNTPPIDLSQFLALSAILPPIAIMVDEA